ncbi:MAG: ATP-binding cassette domain-containing protein [Clostridiales bacterium]|nr:ATP-binding cassette domain-containing protein [Clostridiales bacterium]
MREIDRISPSMLAVFEDKGYLQNDMIAFALSDMNAERVRTDNGLLLTENGLAVLSGSNAVVNQEPAKNQKHKTPDCAFQEIAYQFFPLDEFDSLRVEELISSIRLVGVKDQTYTLITYGSFTAKDSLVILCRCFESVKEGKALPEAEERDEKYCPRCGRRYADTDRKICPHCMDKSVLIKKMWFFLKKYKTGVLLVLLTLVLTNIVAIVTPYISSGFYFDQVLTVGGRFYGQLLLVIMLIVSTRLLQVFIDIINGLITARVSAKLMCDIKKVIFSAIERLSVSFFSGRQTGGLMSQVDNDSGTIYWLFCDGLPYFIVNIVQIITVFVIILIMNPLLALISMVTAPAALFVFIKLIAKTRKLHAKAWTKRRRMNGILADSIAGVRVVKAFSKEKNEIDRFENASDQSIKADRRVSVFQLKTTPFASLLMQLSLYLVWGFGGWFVVNHTMGMTYGTLLVFIAYVSMIINPLVNVVDMVSMFSDFLNSMQRLSEIMDALPDVAEPSEPISLGECKGSVEFDNVSFSYVKNRTVIDHINLAVAAGHRIGIVGHSGAGKSTIANLILRLYDAEEGAVLIDGVNVKRIPFKELRENIAIVSQETYLFYGSIFENIKYAKPDATYDEVLMASKIAGAHDFIMKLDDGYDTKIGFGYRDLSGGERQRVSIARALLHNPKILILDEATSAMDTETEMKIQSALDELTKGRTTITIAHRLSTLRGSDRLLVIENGKICESGTHDELMQKEDGVYHKLYTLQAEALKNIVIAE